MCVGIYMLRAHSTPTFHNLRLHLCRPCFQTIPEMKKYDLQFMDGGCGDNKTLLSSFITRIDVTRSGPAPYEYSLNSKAEPIVHYTFSLGG
jgi:hypothetical protein